MADSSIKTIIKKSINESLNLQELKDSISKVEASIDSLSTKLSELIVIGTEEDTTENTILLINTTYDNEEGDN